MWILCLLAVAAATDPVEGCPASVDALPDSPLYRPDDPRLHGGALVVVLKDARRLALYQQGQRAACYAIALAAGYVPGHKQRQGDLRTPEGWQRTSDRPWSMYHSAITVHYPGPHDAARGLRAGLIDEAQHDAILAAHAAGRPPPMETRLGGRIVIHGGGGRTDWTLGCVGMEDADIDALRTMLPGDMRTDLLVLP